MKALILQPFGIKGDIDFDRVAHELYVPALLRLGVQPLRADAAALPDETGSTQLLQHLLTADVVLADVSVSDPGVFYELGLRHALRARGAILMRAQPSPGPIPSVLAMARYFAYDAFNPAGALEQLVDVVRATMSSDRRDSPVFNLLPDLGEQKAANFQVVPSDFLEELNRARQERRAGDLMLLAAEVEGAGWEQEGLRRVGKAQRDIRAWRSALGTWQAIQRADPDDADANSTLGLIYLRLRDFGRSNEALRRVLESPSVGRDQRVEARLLIGQGTKQRWVEEWRAAPPDQRRERALRSPWLSESYEAYAAAFRENLNNPYAGLSAMLLLTITLELARALSEVWEDRFDSETEAKLQLESLAQQLAKLTGATEFALQSAVEQAGARDPWLNLSQADFALMTSRRGGRVASQYQRAVAAVGPWGAGVARDELAMLQELGIMAENVQAALHVIETAAEPAPQPVPAAGRIVLFIGHRLDSPEQPKPRFPAAGESVVAKEIMRTLAGELDSGRLSLGIAGGSDGGDILFHEACRALGIPTQVYLAVPPETYAGLGVQPAWLDRFYRLLDQSPPRVLSSSFNLPPWLATTRWYRSIWDREARWKLFNALDADSTTLIVLWDGETAEIGRDVQEARARGAKVVILDTNALFPPA